MTASASPKRPRIQALARASAIIDVIAAGGAEGVGLSEISRAAALNKTTAFNLLASLVTLRFIEQDEHSRWYRLGVRNVELGRIVQKRLHIPNLARPILMDLCDKTKETVSLGLPDLHDLFVVDSIGGSHFLHVSANPGSRSMYHCTALGKAMLAQWDAPIRHTLYRLCGFAATNAAHDHRYRHPRCPAARDSGTGIRSRCRGKRGWRNLHWRADIQRI